MTLGVFLRPRHPFGVSPLANILLSPRERLASGRKASWLWGLTGAGAWVEDGSTGSLEPQGFAGFGRERSAGQTASADLGCR